jgi:hypothetical protein
MARALNRDFLLAMGHVGPIHWDVDAMDWACWRDGIRPEACADRYLDAIRRAGRGIVLMHDSTADLRHLRGRNRTREAVARLVPALKREGFRFVGLDEVPEVAEALRAPARVRLGPETWEVIDLGRGRVALRSGDGRFLSARGGKVVADGAAIGEEEVLDVVQAGLGRVAFRTASGHYLSRRDDDGGRIGAQADRMREREVFAFAFDQAGGSASE